MSSSHLKHSESKDSLFSNDSSDSLNRNNAKIDLPIEEIEYEISKCIRDGNSDGFEKFCDKIKSSTLLQVFLTYSYPNRPPSNMEGLNSRSQSLTIDDGSQAATALLNVSQAQSSLPQLNRSRSSSIHSVVETVTRSRSGSICGSPTRESNSMLQLPDSLGGSPTKDNQAGKNGRSVPPFYCHEPEIQEEAEGLLGASVSPLNFLQIACILGEVDIAMMILQFVYKHTHRGQKLLLFEFIGKKWGDGNTSLHLAAFQGMHDLVEKLLDYGAHVDKRNALGYKPVDCAADDETLQVIKNYVDSGRHLENRTRPPVLPIYPQLAKSIERSMRLRKESAPPKYTPPVPVAPKTSNLTIKTSEIIRKSNSEASLAPPKSAPLTQRASEQNLEDVQIDIESYKASPSKPRRVVHWDKHALLLDFCKNGELSEVEGLLNQYQCNKEILNLTETFSFGNQTDDIRAKTLYINRPSAQGLTAIHLACAYGHLEITKLLLNKGANINARDIEGFTPLHALITEIPPPVSTSAVIQTNNMAKKKVNERQSYLNMLKWLLSLPDVDLRLLTDEGETILDLVPEDDMGRLDTEVMNEIEKELLKRNIELIKMVSTETESRAQTADTEASIGSTEDDEVGDDIAETIIVPSPRGSKQSVDHDEPNYVARASSAENSYSGPPNPLNLALHHDVKQPNETLETSTRHGVQP